MSSLNNSIESQQVHLERHKVYAYITYGNDILVFKQPEAPEAGIQVPGGTVEEGETHSQAALREAAEETGLEGFKLVKKLGATQRLETFGDGKTVKTIRHFYHLTVKERESDTWDHMETQRNDGGPPVRFSFSWMTFKEAQNALIETQKPFISMLFPR